MSIKMTGLLLCAVVGAGVAAPSAAYAQRAGSGQSVASLLQAFEREIGRTDGRGRTPSGITHMLVEPGAAPAARLDSLFNGLEALAVRSSNDRVAIMAVISMASAGTRDSGGAQPGMVARLERIHQTAATKVARIAALERLPFQADTGAAVRAIERAAVRRTAEQAYPGSAREAVALLRELGPAGEAALRRLQQTAGVQDCDARAELVRQLGDLP
jgi:hypothetical protein